MNFGEAISSGFSNCVNFSGRSPRSAFWYWSLFAFIITVLANSIDRVAGTDFLHVISALILALPGIAVSVRRLHDVERSGWWMFLTLTILGAFVLLAWQCCKGTDGPNSFGPDPLAPANTATGRRRRSA